jgi:hypothetical protein
MDIIVANLSEYEPVWSGSREKIRSPYQSHRCSRTSVNIYTANSDRNGRLTATIACLDDRRGAMPTHKDESGDEV